jgi:hypothetical protein
MIFVSRVLRIGKSSLSQVTYTREALEELVENWKKKDSVTFGTLEESSDNMYSKYVDLEKVASKVVHMEVDDEGLVVHQEILDTPCGENLKQILPEGRVEDVETTLKLRISPIMDGTTDENKVASNLIVRNIRFDALPIKSSKE